MAHENVRRVTQAVLKPLCKATEKIFQPLHLSPDDWLRVTLNEDGTRFVFMAGSRKRVTRPADWGRSRTNPDWRWEPNGYPTPDAAHIWAARLPERKQVLGEYGCWDSPTTDITALIINALWPEDQLELSKEAEIVYEYLIARFMHQTSAAAARARFAETGELPPLNVLDRKDLPLAPYQKLGLAGVMHQEGTALFMDMGTGKTPIVISRVCNEAVAQENGIMYRVLIVAPKNVRSNWRNEFVRFATVPGKVTLLHGGQLERVKQLVEAFQPEDDCKWTAVVCSYESLLRSWDAIRMVEWDLAVLDESHYIKSPWAKRSKKIVQQLRPLAKQRMALTGTPMTNSLLDLYYQLEWLGEGLSGFSNWKAFRTYYGKWMKRGRFNMLVGYQNVPIIQERLARLAFMIRKKEALPDLPDKTYDVVDVEMTDTQRKAYRDLQTRLTAEIKRDYDTAKQAGRVVSAQHVLTRLLRLAQITSGFVVYDAVYTDDGEETQPKEVDRFDPNPKVEALVEILKAKGPSEKTLVWACWIPDIKTIAARLRLEGIDCVTYYGGTSDVDRDEAERRFNEDPACKVLIGNPAAGGVGLNFVGHSLTGAETATDCDHEIYFSQNWSMVHRTQSEDRAHRRGTRKHVRCTDLCVPGSIDEEIRVRVVTKRTVALKVQDVHEILERVLATTIEDVD